ncbi:NAD-dependent epimerase/dehydratase family protein [Bacillus horti]|uniref:Nucleoside-diphosphate-sugar epimerase n=1 Tax=Caldalkalibacillus horti TaxID=77523 RepID=A0ABT9W229_9BACI|nr:NAD-dependent epimerase/dehydratase family protein [Bacillus horti]MDQ0167276.1 nucleoside-diphosphate-sugar epimerase [Bacillus horti]
MKSEELHVVIGTGPLGMAVMEQLDAQGKHVRMVNRSGTADAPNHIKVVKGDATDEGSFSQACHGATIIYNCTKAPYTEWPEKFPPIMDGIIKAATQEGAKVVYADNLYMYGYSKDSLAEEMPNATTGRKGITRAKMADQLLDAHHKGLIRATIGRAPDFYGPRVLDSALGERVFGAALSDKPAEVLGDIDTPHAYIYIRDFAKGLVRLGEHKEALGQIWHIPFSDVLTTRQMINNIYRLVEHEPKFRIAPKLFVSVLSLFNANMREIKEMLYLFEEPFLVDTSKYEKVFGRDVTPHEVAIKETMEWFKHHQR